MGRLLPRLRLVVGDVDPFLDGHRVVRRNLLCERIAEHADQPVMHARLAAWLLQIRVHPRKRRVHRALLL